MTAVTAQTVRHRHRRPPLTRRTLTTVSTRIPPALNRALDFVSRHRFASACVAVAAVAGATTAVSSPAGVLVAAVGLVIYIAAVGHVAQVTSLQEKLRQAEYDNAALKAENAQLRAGDPSAVTAQIRTIGDLGEPS